MEGVRFLDSKVKLLWMLPTAMTLASFVMIGVVISISVPGDFTLAGVSKHDAPLFIILIGGALCVPVYAWVELIYRNFTYELRASDIVVREGVLTRKTTVIPYITIQDISSERTLLERTLGLATLEIETAGSSHTASESLIPGIANKDALIAEIMNNVKNSKGAGGVLAASNQRDSAEHLLEAILQELKTLSSKFDNLALKNGKNGVSGAPKEKKSAFDEYEKFRKK